MPGEDGRKVIKHLLLKAVYDCTDIFIICLWSNLVMPSLQGDKGESGPAGRDVSLLSLSSWSSCSHSLPAFHNTRQFHHSLSYCTLHYVTLSKYTFKGFSDSYDVENVIITIMWISFALWHQRWACSRFVKAVLVSKCCLIMFLFVLLVGMLFSSCVLWPNDLMYSNVVVFCDSVHVIMLPYSLPFLHAFCYLSVSHS